MPTPRLALQRRCFWCCRGWTPRAKAASCAMWSVRSDPKVFATPRSKAPTAEEKEHPFLWRIRNALPRPGQIGVFDRSHYEDVLIVRVHNLVPPATWGRRYGQINAFEQKEAQAGTTIVKVMLHISSDEQKARLTERLDARTSTGSTTPATWTSASSGRNTSRRTRWPSTGARRRALRGSSSRRTASGTPGWRFSSCWSSTCERWRRNGRQQPLTSKPRRHGWPRPSIHSASTVSRQGGVAA